MIPSTSFQYLDPDIFGTATNAILETGPDDVRFQGELNTRRFNSGAGCGEIVHRTEDVEAAVTPGEQPGRLSSCAARKSKIFSPFIVQSILGFPVLNGFASPFRIELLREKN